MSQPTPPKHFSLEPQRHGDTVLVRLGGEFDLAAEQHFDDMVDAAIDGAGTIVVDLSAVTFIDSSGLRALLRLWQRSRREDFEMAVVPGPDQVRNTIKLTGMDTVLPVVEDSALPPRLLGTQEHNA